jgi:hypothetical protein
MCVYMYIYIYIYIYIRTFFSTWDRTRGSHMLGKHPTTELHPQPSNFWDRAHYYSLCSPVWPPIPNLPQPPQCLNCSHMQPWLSRLLYKNIFVCLVWFFGLFLLLVLYWGYIVTFAKVLTLYHTWAHPPHDSPFPLSPIPRTVSTGLIFPLLYMST